MRENVEKRASSSKKDEDGRFGSDARVANSSPSALQSSSFLQPSSTKSGGIVMLLMFSLLAVLVLPMMFGGPVSRNNVIRDYRNAMHQAEEDDFESFLDDLKPEQASKFRDKYSMRYRRGLNFQIPNLLTSLLGQESHGYESHHDHESHHHHHHDKTVALHHDKSTTFETVTNDTSVGAMPSSEGVKIDEKKRKTQTQFVKFHSERLHGSLEHVNFLQKVMKAGFVALIQSATLVFAGIGLDMPPGKLGILGVATLMGSAIGAGISEWLAVAAEQDFMIRERELERIEIVKEAESEKKEMTEHYMRKGLSSEHAHLVADILSQYPEFWLNHMLYEELQLDTKKIIDEENDESVSEVGASGRESDSSSGKSDNLQPAEQSGTSVTTTSVTTSTTHTTISPDMIAAARRASIRGKMIEHGILITITYFVLGLIPLISFFVDLSQYDILVSYVFSTFTAFFGVGVMVGSLVGATNIVYFGLEFLATGILTTVLAFVATRLLKQHVFRPRYWGLVLTPNSIFLRFLIALWITLLLLVVLLNFVEPHYLKVIFMSVGCCLCTGIGCIPFFFLKKGILESEHVVARANLVAAGMMVGASWSLLDESMRNFIGSANYSESVQHVVRNGISSTVLNLIHDFLSPVAAEMIMGRTLVMKTAICEFFLNGYDFVASGATAIYTLPAVSNILESTSTACGMVLNTLSKIGIPVEDLGMISTRNFFEPLYYWLFDDRMSIALSAGMIFMVLIDRYMGAEPSEILVEMQRERLEKIERKKKRTFFTTTTDFQENGTVPATDDEFTCSPLPWSPAKRTPSHDLSKRVHNREMQENKDSEKADDQELVQGRNEVSFGSKAIVLFLAMFFHAFAEGIALGVSFAEDNQLDRGLGAFVCLALGVHNIPEGLIVGLSVCSHQSPSSDDSPTKTRDTDAGKPGDRNADKAGVLNGARNRNCNNTSEITSLSNPAVALLLAILSSAPQPLMALLSCICVSFAVFLLPYGLAFAAGAMLYVSYTELWLEAREHVPLIQSLFFFVSAFVSMHLISVSNPVGPR